MGVRRLAPEGGAHVEHAPHRAGRDGLRECTWVVYFSCSRRRRRHAPNYRRNRPRVPPPQQDHHCRRALNSMSRTRTSRNSTSREPPSTPSRPSSARGRTHQNIDRLEGDEAENKEPVALKNLPLPDASSRTRPTRVCSARSSSCNPRSRARRRAAQGIANAAQNIRYQAALTLHKAENDKDIYLVFEYMETDLHAGHPCPRTSSRIVHKQCSSCTSCCFPAFKALKYMHSAGSSCTAT